MSKVVDELFSNGKWVQRVTVGDKYTWTISGSRWNNLKDRCNPNSSLQKREPTYIGSINKFECWNDFISWSKYQVGYSNRDYQLDSDVLKIGSKIYSEETCLFIPSRLNKFLQHRSRPNSDLPTGLFICKSTPNLIQCKISSWFDGGTKFLGCYKLDEIELATEAYLKEKNRHRILWIDYLTKTHEIDPRVITYLESIKFTKRGKEVV